jgi:hypothetical protein
MKFIQKDKNFNDVEVIEVDQKNLSSECWLIQFQGLRACDNCDLKNTDDCGGQNIRKTLQNDKGIKITKTKGI